MEGTPLKTFYALVLVLFSFSAPAQTLETIECRRWQRVGTVTGTGSCEVRLTRSSPRSEAAGIYLAIISDTAHR